jgi:hypothetical protein
MCHYYNMHLTAEHNGWFTNYYLCTQYLTVYTLGFVFRQPISLCMYISTGQEFNCVMCAACYSSMSGYAHTCAHTVTYWQSICGTCRCTINCVWKEGGSWQHPANTGYDLIWQLKVSGQLQVQDVHEKYLNSANTQGIFCHHAAHHRADIVTANALCPHNVQNAQLFFIILYIRNYFKEEKYCYAYIFQNAVLCCTCISNRLDF